MASSPADNDHYLTRLQGMFPALDHACLADCCRDCHNDDEFQRIVESMFDASVVSQKQGQKSAGRTEESESEHPFFGAGESSQPHRYLTFLVEMFPNMSQIALAKHCESFNANVDLDTLVASLTQRVVESVEEGEHDQEDYSRDSDGSGDSLPSPRKHRRVMELVEMFPDVPVNMLERLSKSFPDDATLDTMAESLLQLDASTKPPESDRLIQLIEMFPHIDLDVLQRRCNEVDPDEPLDRLVGTLMAQDEPRNENLQQLINVFPHVAVEDLEDVCKQHGPGVSLNTLVLSVVNSLGLRGASTAAQGAAAFPPEESIEQLDAYQSLLNILPNADPDFLRQKFESFSGDDEALKLFVTEALEHQNYPTYEEYSKRSQKTRLQRQYRDEFNPKSYLEALPDPIGHFGDKTYAATKPLLEQEKAFLQSRYGEINDGVIDRVYVQEKYNLYKTCKRLDRFEGPFSTAKETDPFKDCYDKIVSKELLQEIALIINEERIDRYIKDQNNAREKALEQARKSNELLSCGCCYDDRLLLADMVACSDGHLFCKQCLIRSAEVQIGDGKLVFPCLLDCGKNFTQHTLKAVLKPSMFFKMAQRQQLEEVQAANIAELETCPFCDFGAIPAQGDKVFTCLNTDCMRISCRYCKEPNHIPKRCDELPERDEQVKARTQIEDSMTLALVRECYQCKKKFVKTSGCNQMRCTCGASMCYLCRVPIANDHSHFTGYGGRCQLYTTDVELHDNQVQAAAARARAAVIAASKNPEFALKHDPTRQP